ncbi:MAG: molybdenum cofactor biosynthesis protein MoaE [Thermoplasmata archaeon]
MIVIKTTDFSVDEAISKIKNETTGTVVSFVGLVRGASRSGKVRILTIEAYKKMALEELNKIERIARKKFDIADVMIIHRTGSLKVGDNIVLIAVSSPHRKEAFRACEYLIDELKKIVPIWKKEIREDGSCWVKARRSKQHRD